MNYKEKWQKYLKELQTSYSGIDSSNIPNMYEYKGYEDAIGESVQSLQNGKKIWKKLTENISAQEQYKLFYKIFDYINKTPEPSMNSIQSALNALKTIAHKLIAIGSETGEVARFNTVEIGKWTVIIDKIKTAFQKEYQELNTLRAEIQTIKNPSEKFNKMQSLENRDNRLRTLRHTLKILMSPSMMGNDVMSKSFQIKETASTDIEDTLDFIQQNEIAFKKFKEKYKNKTLQAKNEEETYIIHPSTRTGITNWQTTKFVNDKPVSHETRETWEQAIDLIEDDIDWTDQTTYNVMTLKEAVQRLKKFVLDKTKNAVII